MRDYERLRKALEDILLVLGPSYAGQAPDPDIIDEIDDDWFGDRIEDIVTKALADTAEDSEMERLVVWLEDERRYELGGSGECVLDRLAEFLESFGYHVRDAVDVEIDGRIQDEAWDGCQPDCMP